MKKTLWMLALAGVFLAGVAGAEETIRIGHTVSLTGGSSMWGLAEQNALDMLAEELNAAGGVLGKKLELIHYDNRGDAVESVNVARRLVDDGAVAVIGPAQSGNSMASAPVFEAAGIPMVVTTATNPAVTVDPNSGQVRPLVFRPCFIDPFQGTIAAQFAFEDLKARKPPFFTMWGPITASGSPRTSTRPSRPPGAPWWPRKPSAPRNWTTGPSWGR